MGFIIRFKSKERQTARMYVATEKACDRKVGQLQADGYQVLSVFETNSAQVVRDVSERFGVASTAD